MRSRLLESHMLTDDFFLGNICEVMTRSRVKRIWKVRALFKSTQLERIIGELHLVCARRGGGTLVHRTCREKQKKNRICTPTSCDNPSLKEQNRFAHLYTSSYIFGHSLARWNADTRLLTRNFPAH